MLQETPKQQLSFIEKLQQVERNLSNILQKIKSIPNNIVILGESGAGKSTLCNILMNKKIIFKYECLQFKPVEDKSEMQFKIASDATQSQTDFPQVETLSDLFQICDIPGLQDSKSGLNDIITCINIQKIVNSSQVVQLVLVIAEKEFTENKFKYLIEILNQFQENDMVMTFLITFVEEEQTKDYLCELLEKLLNQPETKLSEKAKQLLKRTLDLKEDRINILSKLMKSQRDNCQFKQEEIEIIRKNILRPEMFKKQDLKFSFTNVNKQEIKPVLNDMQKELDIIWNSLEQTSRECWISVYQIVQPYDEQYIEYIQSLKQKEQHDITRYNKKLSEVNYLSQLILQHKSLNLYETHKNELQQIVENLEIVQQYSTLKIFCSFLNTSKLNKILKEQSQFDKVFIYSIVQFQVDQSVEQPGISIYIKTNEFIITSSRQVEINLRGRDGQTINPRKAGQDKKNGQNGLPGHDGLKGGTLIVDTLKYTNMSLLTINVSGGDGSDGQDGGDGQDGENGKDADPGPVDKKDQNYVVLIVDKQITKEELKKLEERQQQMDQAHLRQMEMDQESGLKLQQFQELIQEKESNTLNKVRVFILENKGSPGFRGGNSGHGGVGGIGGMKGLVQLKNLGNQEPILIDFDGKKGQNGQDGRVGKGGSYGRYYKRAYLDVSYYKGGMSKVKIFFYVIGSIATFGTLFIGLSLANLALFLFKDGNWISNGDFIDKKIKAPDGNVNPRNIEQKEFKSTDSLMILYEFKEYVKVKKASKSSPNFRYLMDSEYVNSKI